MPEEDSSSLNVSQLVIFGIEQVSPEVVKINSSTGLAFFIRYQYLKVVQPDDLCINANFEGEEEQDLIDAGLCYAAEAKATSYLARAEQCRFRLTQKLLEKKYEKQYIERALDYLESKNYLNDVRYSVFWLNSRKINHFEGRSKLQSELMSRGISKQNAKDALDSFFTENTEEELCLKAFDKCKRQQKDTDETVKKLLSLGFSYRMIKDCISENNF